jgi:hypothetical protein
MVRKLKPDSNPPAMNPPYDGTASHQQDFNSHIEGRVGRLEGAVENLTHEVQETSKVVRDIASGLGKFKEDVLGHIGQATAPKWPLIVSFVMVALTIISLGSTVVYQSMSGQSAALAKMTSRMDSFDERELRNVFLDGKHEAWRENIEKITTKLDVDLQREMRLVNENTDSKLQALTKTANEKLTELQGQIVNMRDWRLAHEATNSRAHGEQDAKLLQTMRDIERIEGRQYDIGRLVSQLDYLRPNGGITAGAAVPAHLNGGPPPLKSK